MKFRTIGPQYLPGDRYVDGGIEIGDDTAFPLPRNYVPSRAMEGTDTEGKRLVAQLHEDNSPGGSVTVRRALGTKEAENDTLRKEISQLRAMLASSGPAGQEPFYPETSTGPTAFPQNIGKEATGAGVPAKDIPRDAEEQRKRDEGDLPHLRRPETPIGASSTTPPRETIGVENPDPKGLPAPRTSRNLAELLGNQPATRDDPLPKESDGGQTQPEESGQEMPQPPEPPEGGPKPDAREGDQKVENPMENTAPNVGGDLTKPGGNAPGPLGARAKK